MSTRELRPRTPRITNAFNISKLATDTSKLVVKKKGGPKKFDTALAEKIILKEPTGKYGSSGDDNTSKPTPSTTSPLAQDEESSISLKRSNELLTPPAEDMASEDESDEHQPSSSELSSTSLEGIPLATKKPKNRTKKEATKSPPKKKNKLKYPPGTTPYPELEHPTPEECIEVAALLTAAHGPAIRPETVPKPDNSVSGCGEVPSVIDALARTVLSANTSNTNSSRAFKGLVDVFGIIPHEPDIMLGEEEMVGEDGEAKIKLARKIGEGSVNWDNVRRAPMKDLVEAIKTGGMAVTKAKHIKHILDVAWEEGRALKKVKQEEKGIEMKDDGHEMKDDGHEMKEDSEEGQGGVSLEYVRDMGDDEVMAKLMSFDGVGCKTASCVALFCLGRPKFPVDTHVWRISKYLSWIPAKATREDAYHHLDTRIPNDLKYSLHCLLIRHGRTCKHCKAGPQAATTPTSKGLKKRARGDEGKKEDGEPGEPQTKKMKIKKVWVGTGMMKEVVVEVPDDGIEQGPEEESLEACVLEQLIKERERKPRAG